MPPTLDGQLVRYWREKRDLTQEQLAEMVQEILRKDPPFTRASVAMWESGQNGMTGKSREAVLEALGLTAAEFYRAETKLDETAA